jgi:hypothetical protein
MNTKQFKNALNVVRNIEFYDESEWQPYLLRVARQLAMCEFDPVFLSILQEFTDLEVLSNILECALYEKNNRFAYEVCEIMLDMMNKRPIHKKDNNEIKFEPLFKIVIEGLKRGLEIAYKKEWASDYYHNVECKLSTKYEKWTILFIYSTGNNLCSSFVKDIFSINLGYNQHVSTEEIRKLALQKLHEKYPNTYAIKAPREYIEKLPAERDFTPVLKRIDPTITNKTYVSLPPKPSFTKICSENQKKPIQKEEVPIPEIDLSLDEQRTYVKPLPLNKRSIDRPKEQPEDPFNTHPLIDLKEIDYKEEYKRLQAQLEQEEYKRKCEEIKKKLSRNHIDTLFE